MQNSRELIKKDMLISKVVKKHPEVSTIFRGYKLHCIGCDASSIETIEQGAKTHGLDDKEIEFMLKDVNTIALEK